MCPASAAAPPRRLPGDPSWRAIAFVAASLAAVSGAALLPACGSEFTGGAAGAGATPTASTSGGSGGGAGATGGIGPGGGSAGSVTTGPGGSGGAPECVLPSDCPGSSDACALSDCEDGHCVEALATAGTDCGENSQFCDGEGACLECGGEADLPEGTCPTDVCTDSCAGDLCIIDCSGSACDRTTISCPAGFECRVDCSGANSCWETTIVCPEVGGCIVNCVADSSCHAAVVQCSALAPCAMNCTAMLYACAEGARMECGLNECHASCANGSYAPQQPECEAACLCDAVNMGGNEPCPVSQTTTAAPLPPPA